MTVVAWIVFAGLISSIAPKLADVESNKDVNDPPAAAQSMEARALEGKAFGGGKTPAIIVVRDREGLGQAGLKRVAAVVADLESASQRIDNLGKPVSPLGSAGRKSSLLSRDGTTAQIIVPISGAASEDALGATVIKVRRIVDRTVDGHLEVAVTGPAGIVRDVTEAFGGASLVLLAATVLLVLVLLLIIYRSPLLAVIPIIAVSLALTLTNGIGALLVDAGLFSVSSQAASIMTVLLFGVGTDYSLFIVGRYREELERQPDRYKAMQAAMRNLVEPLTSSALTVVLALITLLLATLPALRGFGPFFALAVIVMVLMALTFIPAIVCLFGRAALWPHRFSARRDSRVWTAVAGLVTRRPVAAGTAAAVVLGVFALGLTQYRESYNFISGLRIATKSEHGQKMLDRAFPPGALAPTTLLVADNNGTLKHGTALTELRDTIANKPGIDSVSPPAFSPDGDVARFQIIYSDDPYGSAALDRTDRLRSMIPEELDGTPLAGSRVLLGGESAVNLDIRSANDRDLLVIAPAIAIVTFLVLAFLFWSLAAPLYLVATLIASYAATMGVTVAALLVFGGDDGIGVRVAIYTFVFLVALGVDYNIFLMTRIREEIVGRGHRAGVQRALIRTGPVITSAGLILAGTFGVLMTQPVRELYQFGFAMAFGLLLDTFVVRGILVPAITTRLAERAWWPDRPTIENRGSGADLR